MIPTTLTIQNFMCYRADSGGEPMGLNLDGLHVVCLSGENGAGKSALLDAITWALWGEARTPDDDLIAQGESEMLVELAFQLGDQHYRVARRRQRGKSGPRGGVSSGKTFLDLQVQDAAGWKPIAEATVRETQQRIDGLLRMSYQTFINASFLLQGRADEFTARTPAERKQVLAEILDLGEYAALEEKAKGRAKGLADQLTGLRGRIEQLEQSAKDLEYNAKMVQDAEEKVTHMGSQVEQAEQALEAADARLRALQEQAERRKSLLRELEALRKQQAEREQEIARLRARIAAAEGLVARRAEIERGVAELAAARAELERLEEQRGRHQELDTERRDLQTQLREALGELRAALGQLEQREQQLEQSAARRDKLLVEVRDLDQQIITLAPLSVEREALAEERQALDQRADQLAELRRRHDQQEALIKLRYDSLVGVREENQRALRRIDGQLADEPRWREELAAARAAADQLRADDTSLAELRAQEQADVDAVSQQRAECTRLNDAAKKLKANQKILAESGGACPVCRSELGAAGVDHVNAHYEAELAELRAAYAEAKRQADAGEARLKEARAALKGLEQQISRLRQVAAQAEPLEGQLRMAEGWRAERAQAQEAHDSADRQIAAREFEPAAQADLVTVKAELAALGEPAELSRQRKTLDKRLRELDDRLRERGKAEGLLHARQEELAHAEEQLAALPALQAEIAGLRRTIDTGDFAHEVRDRGRLVMCRIEQLGYSQDIHEAAREQARGLERWVKDEQELMLAEQRLEADRALLEKEDELRARDSIEIRAAHPRGRPA